MDCTALGSIRIESEVWRDSMLTIGLCLDYNCMNLCIDSSYFSLGVVPKCLPKHSDRPRSTDLRGMACWNCVA
jgi:hypothetical protein